MMQILLLLVDVVHAPSTINHYVQHNLASQGLYTSAGFAYNSLWSKPRSSVYVLSRSCFLLSCAHCGSSLFTSATTSPTPSLWLFKLSDYNFASVTCKKSVFQAFETTQAFSFCIRIMVSFGSNTRVIRNDPYWTSWKNCSLKLLTRTGISLMCKLSTYQIVFAQIKLISHQAS
jgi:hypothetical protein